MFQAIALYLGMAGSREGMGFFGSLDQLKAENLGSRARGPLFCAMYSSVETAREAVKSEE